MGIRFDATVPETARIPGGTGAGPPTVESAPRSQRGSLGKLSLTNSRSCSATAAGPRAR